MKVKTITVVSLSRGLLGEKFMEHEVRLGTERLEAYGIRVKFAPNARMGIEYLRDHPEKRASDLIWALEDEETDMILCAIGGDDTYRLAPYLFGRDELKKAAREKIFLGFSDTTVNHFMLHRVGMKSFYGQAFLPDVCELSREMLPYTRRYFEELITTGAIREITPSDVWYESREDYGPAQLGVPTAEHRDRGFEQLQGSGRFSGGILGGCIDTMFDMFDGTRYGDMPGVCRKYGLFPRAEEWRGKILLLESAEELMPPEKYEQALEYLKSAGVFREVSGVIVGKPMDEVYHEEYKRLLTRVIGDRALPVLCNVNIGHALPRCIIPFGVGAEADAGAGRISFG